MLEAIFLLALNIYHEADVKDEFVCRVQIAQVVIQRSTQTNTSIKQVIYKPKQFSWTIRGLDGAKTLQATHVPNFNSKRWKDSLRAAKQVYYGQAPNSMPGTDHFYADYIKPPYWWKDIKPESVFKCGKHWFGTTKKQYKRKSNVSTLA